MENISESLFGDPGVNQNKVWNAMDKADARRDAERLNAWKKWSPEQKKMVFELVLNLRLGFGEEAFAFAAELVAGDAPNATQRIAEELYSLMRENIGIGLGTLGRPDRVLWAEREIYRYEGGDPQRPMTVYKIKRGGR